MAVSKRKPLRLNRGPDEGAVGWMTKYAVKNHWRVPFWMSVDDLIQEGFVTFAKCCQRYPVVDNRSHRMALFKTMFTNKITDFANERSRIVEIDAPEGVDKNVWLETLNSDENVDGSMLQEIAAVVAFAPKSVGDVLRLMLDGSKAAMLREPYRNKDRSETSNQRFSRLLKSTGIDLDPDGPDMIAEVKKYLLQR